MRIHRCIHILLLWSIAISACAPLEDPTRNWSPERFYKEAKAAMENKDYETAISHFETLESRYPYGRYAVQAQLEVIYAYYKNDDNVLAIASADRFIRQHPTHPHVDYAYYLKGLVNFSGERNIISWLLGGKDDISDRDPKAARDAYQAFRELVERFPNSKYASDARQRIVYLLNNLAKYEINVANYYFSRGAYVAVVNRTKYVLEHYQRTPMVEQALGLQLMAYNKMGLNNLADDTRRVLQKNFPGSSYLNKNGAK